MSPLRKRDLIDDIRAIWIVSLFEQGDSPEAQYQPANSGESPNLGDDANVGKLRGRSRTDERCTREIAVRRLEHL